MSSKYSVNIMIYCGNNCEIQFIKCNVNICNLISISKDNKVSMNNLIENEVA